MPELPEVESVRRGLVPYLEGRTVSWVHVLHDRAIRRHQAGAGDFAGRLVGATFQAPRRRGKYLWVPTDHGDALVAHLGMSGQFRIATADERVGPHVRVRLRFADDANEVRFLDQRTFGGMAVDDLSSDGIPQSIEHVARDPFDPQFDLRATGRRLRSRDTQVKRALLDQGLVSGIGNIYADEALWAARLHGNRLTRRLTASQAVAVLSAATDVMASALHAGGTSFDALYVNVNGESGYFSRELHVYGREGEPCDRCATAIRRKSFTNRSSYFCPHCQPTPRRRPEHPHG